MAPEKASTMTTHKPPAVSDVHILWITAGLSCDGDQFPSPRPSSPALRTCCWAQFLACRKCTFTIPCSLTKMATNS